VGPRSVIRPGVIGCVLAAVLAMGVAGTATAPAATPSATVSALTKAQKKARARALKKCRRLSNAGRRKACIARVNRKYRKISRRNENRPPAGNIYVVAVEDSFFLPNSLTLKAYDWIDWTWRNSTVREGHNVNLTPPFPQGVIATDFQSPGVVSGPGGRFRRQFTKPGTYNLNCSLHPGMKMTVTVEK